MECRHVYLGGFQGLLRFGWNFVDLRAVGLSKASVSAVDTGQPVG